MKDNKKAILLIEVEPKIKRNFKAYCAKNDFSMRHVITALMKNQIKGKTRGQR